MYAYFDDTTFFNLCDQLMDGHVSYQLGAKASLKADAAKIKTLDCSGFVRYVVYNSTDPAIAVGNGGGSVVEREWCQSNQLLAVDYSTAALLDASVRIAFLPAKNGHPGHVWLVYKGQTYESHGGVGPDSRDWNTGVLVQGVSHCFVLGQLTGNSFPSCTN